MTLSAEIDALCQAGVTVTFTQDEAAHIILAAEKGEFSTKVNLSYGWYEPEFAAAAGLVSCRLQVWHSKQWEIAASESISSFMHYEEADVLRRREMLAAMAAGKMKFNNPRPFIHATTY